MENLTSQPRQTPPATAVQASANGKGQLQLDKSLRHPRTLFNFVMTFLTAVATVIALVPLVSVLVTLIYKGAPHLTWSVLTALPPAPGFSGGGFGNAILGTALMVGIAILISVPLGVLAAIYLSEFAGDSKGAELIRFAAKVLTGMPSILAGVFAYALVVVLMRGGFSPIAGGVALAVLMLPIVLLTAEEALKQVPVKMRDAAFGLGATPTQVVWRVVVPTALPGMLTGVMLAVARAAGETAPLLFTALFSDYWLAGKLAQPTASLAVLIYFFSSVPYENQVNMAWTASLVLVFIVLTLNLVGQRLIKSSHQQR